jgi:hypothetical protein
MKSLHPDAEAIRRTLFDGHNPASVAKLEHAICGKDTPPFGRKCGDDAPTFRY